MGAMHGKSSACITSLEYNSELEEHIDSLTESGAVSEDEIKRVIARLCQNMVQFTDFMRLRTNEEMELYVWKSFLRPIKALMKLPHPQGNFVAARMVLYLAYQIHQTLDEKEYLRQADAEKATMPLCQLCIKLDETLLKALRNIWKASTDFEEDFNWVFVDDRIHLAPGEVAMDDNDLKIAQALSPSERTRVSKENGVEYAYYSDPFGVNKANPTPYKGPIPRWDCGQEDTDSFIWSTKSSDGPIRLEISYDVRIPRAGYNGHHDSHDRDWIVERGPGLSLFIEREISRLNDEFVSLDQVGLGPALKIRLDTEEEDRDRQQRLALGQGIYQDSVDDWKMSGGLGGLVDCMLHGRVLVGAWGRDGADKGTMQVPTQWAHGGGLKDQERAIQAIRDLHAWPGCCEWC
ncbi:hypothetical protein FPSE5266_05066 [Fusarium pseudograminearum]|nr:hypothetical protein FPSE5266_05066 [Fusarium pseudograminearum]